MRPVLRPGARLLRRDAGPPAGRHRARPRGGAARLRAATPGGRRTGRRTRRRRRGRRGAVEAACATPRRPAELLDALDGGRCRRRRGNDPVGAVPLSCSPTGWPRASSRRRRLPAPASAPRRSSAYEADGPLAGRSPGCWRRPASPRPGRPRAERSEAAAPRTRTASVIDRTHRRPGWASLAASARGDRPGHRRTPHLRGRRRRRHRRARPVRAARPHRLPALRRHAARTAVDPAWPALGRPAQRPRRRPRTASRPHAARCSRRHWPPGRVREVLAHLARGRSTDLRREPALRRRPGRTGTAHLAAAPRLRVSPCSS